MLYLQKSEINLAHACQGLFWKLHRKKAHVDTPFGVRCELRFRTAPKPPLCKGRWHGEAVAEGLSCSQSMISSWYHWQNSCEKKWPRKNGTYGMVFCVPTLSVFRTSGKAIPQSASLTAPFTQGSLGCCRAGASHKNRPVNWTALLLSYGSTMSKG